MRMLLPAWPLLFWSGLVATVIAAWLLGSLLPAAGARALAPRAQSARALRALLLGTLLYPLLYALPFQFLHRANVITGLAVGAVHALLLAIATPRRERGSWGDMLQRALSVLIYGIVLGFAYVTP